MGRSILTSLAAVLLISTLFLAGIVGRPDKPLWAAFLMGLSAYLTCLCVVAAARSGDRRDRL